ncbi:MAG: hypothetical protein U0794_09870 [Isosphaeraceae bacterium]
MMNRRAILNKLGTTVGAMTLGRFLLGQAQASDGNYGIPETKDGCSVSFRSHFNFKGGLIRIGGPVVMLDVRHLHFDNGERFENNVDSLATGPNTWIEVYEHFKLTGRCLQIGPNERITNLDPVKMGDKISSFRIMNQAPQWWG